MSTAQGWEKWYWRDWKSDPCVRRLTLSSRAIWIEVLGDMWMEETAFWSGDAMVLARQIGCTEAEADAFFDEVEDSGVCDMSRDVTESHTIVTLVSRRRNKELGDKENNKLRKRRQREKGNSHADVTPTHALARESESEKPKTIDRSAIDHTSRFDDFWAVYPAKVDKKKCLAKWKAKKLDRIADQIIANVNHRLTNDSRWSRGIIANPHTYLHNDRWEDPLPPDSSQFSPDGRPMNPEDALY